MKSYPSSIHPLRMSDPNYLVPLHSLIPTFRQERLLPSQLDSRLTSSVQTLLDPRLVRSTSLNILPYHPGRFTQ